MTILLGMLVMTGCGEAPIAKETIVSKSDSPASDSAPVKNVTPAGFAGTLVSGPGIKADSTREFTDALPEEHFRAQSVEETKAGLRELTNVLETHYELQENKK